MKSRRQGEEKYEYRGSLEEFQLYGSQINDKRYAEYEVDPFNQYQNFLYKRALFGLKMYSPEEIQQMTDARKSRIVKLHRRSQKILNIYKQEAVNKITNNLFVKYFPNSPITKALVGELNFTDPEFVNKIDFKMLGISKENIINRLIQEKILPKNFYDLKSITLHE